MAITVGSSVPQFVKEQALAIADVTQTAGTADQDFTVTGLTTDMVVVVNPTSAMAAHLGLGGARVKSANTLTLRFINPTAGTITGATVTFKIVAL